MGRHKRPKKFEPHYEVVERWYEEHDKKRWVTIAQFYCYFDADLYLNALKSETGDFCGTLTERKIKRIKR